MVLNCCLSGSLIYDEMIKFKDPAFYKGAITYPTLLTIFIAINFIFMPKFIYIRQHKALDYSDLRKGIDKKKGEEQATSMELSPSSSSPGETLPRRSTAATQLSFARTGRMSNTSFKPKFAKRATTGTSDSFSSQLSSSPGSGTSPGAVNLDMSFRNTLNPLNEVEAESERDIKAAPKKDEQKQPSKASSEDSRLLTEALAENAELKEGERVD